MAIEKKKASKKSSKDVAANTKKIVKKTPKKSIEPLGTPVDVPKGGQVIKYFHLSPALPAKTAPGDWKFTEVGSSVDISSLVVGFEKNESALEREFERAILVISMQQGVNPKGTWRFALGGVATDQADEDPSNDIEVDVVDNGFTLLVFVHVLAEKNAERIPFRFVASYTDNKTGAVSICESQDPGIDVGRPR